MTDIRELRLVLESHASLAPPDDGIIEAARAGAIRHRRRRRVATAVGAVVVVAAAALSIPMVLDRGGRHGSEPAGPYKQVSPTGPTRQPFDRTLTVVPGSNWKITSYGILDHGAQVMSISSERAVDLAGQAVVVAFDPGTLDPARFQSLQRTTVQGRTAWVLTKGTDPQVTPTDPLSDAAKRAVNGLAWQDPSGTWIEVQATGPVEALREVGELVRLGPPVPVNAPVKLAYLPAGLGVVGVYQDVIGRGTSSPSVVNLSRPRSKAFPGGYVADDPVITVLAGPRGTYVDQQLGNDHGTKLGDLSTWWFTDHTGPISPDGNGAVLVARNATCLIEIDVRDPKTYPYEEAKRILVGLTLADCGRPSTWGAPL